MLLTPKAVEHESLYDHFADRQSEGQFDRYNQDMVSFINYIWNNKMGVVAAMSHSGIGEDTTNGFVQFVVDNPMQLHDLVVCLTIIRDLFKKAEQPVIEIRSKSLPKGLTTVKHTHFLTVMFRTPRFNTKVEANTWWSKLVQSYN